jgi:exopolysaccharide biosynthesis glucuronosyltransferase PssD
MASMSSTEPQNPVRLCIAASTGGHLAEILKTSPAWNNSNCFFITSSESAREQLSRRGPTYCVGEANRFNPFRAIAISLRVFRIMLRERPTVVFSTGALPGCLACLAGKLFGSRIIWLDSFTNINKLSLSGRIVKPLADLFLVQWPELAEKHPGTEYVGSVL